VVKNFLQFNLFAILIVVLVVAFAILIIVSPYRRDRIFGFMDPWSDAYGRGYQLSHALIAFGRGELLGVGLGASVEKLFYLPEAHTDFLLAVIAGRQTFTRKVELLDTPSIECRPPENENRQWQSPARKPL